MADVSLGQRFGRWIKAAPGRLWRHLRRTSGLASAFVGLLSIGGYILLKNSGLPVSFVDPASQVTLILASVAIGAWFLPELTSKLWELDSDAVRADIPVEKRAKLARALIGAESRDEDWNTQVWNNGLAPLLEASRAASSYIHNMTYSATIKTNRTLTLGSRKVIAHAVAVEQESDRVIGRQERLWISTARTEDALSKEFGRPGCLGRELVPFADLTGEEWQQAVMETCKAEITIAGDIIELTATAHAEDIVRWYAPEDYRPPKKQVHVKIAYDFHLDPDVERFPVMFQSYYCAGVTQISLKLNDPDAVDRLGCDYFVGHSLVGQESDQVKVSSRSTYKMIRFSTAEKRILWPGSGVMFRWTPAP